jgi:hypothetical protein
LTNNHHPGHGNADSHGNGNRTANAFSFGCTPTDGNGWGLGIGKEFFPPSPGGQESGIGDADGESNGAGYHHQTQIQEDHSDMTKPTTPSPLTVEDAATFLRACFPPPPPHPFVGRFCIMRCQGAGVHAGYLVSQNGDQAVLSNSRRLWSWKTRDGIALSGLAIHGLEEGKIDTLLPDLALTGVVETIPCTDFSRDTILAA